MGFPETGGFFPVNTEEGKSKESQTYKGSGASQ